MNAQINFLERKVGMEYAMLPSIEDIKYQFQKGEKIHLIVRQVTKTTLVTYLVVGSWSTIIDSEVDGYKTKANSVGEHVFLLSKKQYFKEYKNYLERAIPKALEFIKKKIGVSVSQEIFDIYQYHRNDLMVIPN